MLAFNFHTPQCVWKVFSDESFRVTPMYILRVDEQMTTTRVVNASLKITVPQILCEDQHTVWPLYPGPFGVILGVPFPLNRQYTFEVGLVGQALIQTYQQHSHPHSQLAQSQDGVERDSQQQTWPVSHPNELAIKSKLLLV